MKDAQWRRRTLDERTDRLARRLFTFPLDRDTYLWAMLRLDIAKHDAARVIIRDLTPAFERANVIAREAREAMERLAERFLNG